MFGSHRRRAERALQEEKEAQERQRLIDDCVRRVLYALDSRQRKQNELENIAKFGGSANFRYNGGVTLQPYKSSSPDRENDSVTFTMQVAKNYDGTDVNTLVGTFDLKGLKELNKAVKRAIETMEDYKKEKKNV